LKNFNCKSLRRQRSNKQENNTIFKKVLKKLFLLVLQRQANTKKKLKFRLLSFEFAIANSFLIYLLLFLLFIVKLFL